MNRKQLTKSSLFLLLLLSLTIGGVYRANKLDNPLLRGETMGTSYSIRLCGNYNKKDCQLLADEINDLFLEINQQMSTWIKESQISLFNNNLSTNPIFVSENFYKVTSNSLIIAKESGGAFDPTLQPLLNLWGFGSESDNSNFPSNDDIKVVLQRTGWEKLKLLRNNKIQKLDGNVSLALGAIAKGYSVDLISDILTEKGYSNYFIEVGGEVKVKGLNPEGNKWKIGIQDPEAALFDYSLHGVVNIESGALATSGGYRNFIEKNGESYAHIIDPRNGQAINSDILSISVLSDKCIDADGWATALYVLGVEAGLSCVESKPNIEALFIRKSVSNEIETILSSRFKEKANYVTIKSSEDI